MSFMPATFVFACDFTSARDHKYIIQTEGYYCIVVVYSWDYLKIKMVFLKLIIITEILDGCTKIFYKRFNVTSIKHIVFKIRN